MWYGDGRYAVFAKQFGATLFHQSEVWPVYVNRQFKKEQTKERKACLKRYNAILKAEEQPAKCPSSF